MSRTGNLGLAVFAALAMILPAAASAQTYHDDALRWSVHVPAGWRAHPAETVAAIDREFTERVGQKSFTYIAAFTKAGPTEEKPGPAAEKPGPLLTYPYLLVQSTPAQLSGRTYEEIAGLFNAELMTEATRRVSEAVKDIGKLDAMPTPQIDPARNRMVFDVAMNVAGIGDVKGRCVGFFGREGIIQLSYYAPASEFESGLADFGVFTDSFAFDPGYAFVSAAPRAGGPSSALSTGLIAGGVGAVGAMSYILLKRRSNKNTAQRPGAAGR